ncbi:type II toxin-antitoxin system prevent-host-death family antitoxin [bacterium]|nr:type II toxin-antitoxin system prevent-host-death family antitoxin [bacterium]
MKFVTVRDLRSRSAQIWKELADEQEMVITNNGRPVAILSSTNEADLEMSLNSIRRARMSQVIAALQQESLKGKKHTLRSDEIEREIAASRRALRE